MTALSTPVQTAQRTPTNVPWVPIDPALAKRVRAAAQAAERKRQERDELIAEAHRAGASLREIGALVGLSHVGVMKIVNKGEVPRKRTGPTNKDGLRRPLSEAEFRELQESLGPGQVLDPDGTIRNVLGPT